MRIRQQTWIEGDTFIQLTLKEPYFTAGLKYGWAGDLWGFGLSLEAIKYAFKVNKNIRIVVLKYGKWQISPHMALRRAKEFKSHYTARDGKDLVIVPRMACHKVEKSDIQKKLAEQKEEMRTRSIQQTLI